jgi:hypothetical protein
VKHAGKGQTLVNNVSMFCLLDAKQAEKKLTHNFTT